MTQLGIWIDYVQAGIYLCGKPVVQQMWDLNVESIAGAYVYNYANLCIV